MQCIICNKHLPNEWVNYVEGYKNNSLPLMSNKHLKQTNKMVFNPNYVCCNECNSNYVIPIRMMCIKYGLDETKSKLKDWLKSNKLKLI